MGFEIRSPVPASIDRHVAVAALPGVQLSSLGVVTDAFAHLARLVADQSPPTQPAVMRTSVRLLTTAGRTVRAADGRSLACDGDLTGHEAYRLVFVPAFLAAGEEEVARLLRQRHPLIDWLARQHRQGAVLAASGAATLLLARTGLLDHREAAVPAMLVPLWRKHFPNVRLVSNRQVVDALGVLTCAAASHEWLLALRAVERVISPLAAQALAQVVGLQTEIPALVSTDDRLVSSAQYWLSQRYAKDPRMSDLVSALAVSHATLLRRFQRSLGITPRDYVQQLRISTSCHLLRSTMTRIDEIGARVGYADVRAFRRQFARHMGCSPSTYRQRHHLPARDAADPPALAECSGRPA